jgi:hypothetical protein
MSDITLSKACQLSTRLNEMAPWNYLEEIEVFGVRMPDSGKQYFVSIMGAAGEHYGMAAYEDVQGLLSFWDLQQPARWMRPSELLLIPHLMVSFENRDMIDPPDRKKMKELGFSFRGRNAWPLFRHVIPGFLPFMPEDEALDHLVIVMEQAINVFERAKTGIGFIHPENMDENVYLVRAMSGQESGPGQWNDTYWQMELPKMNHQMNFIARERDKISSLPKSRDTFQADIALLSYQIAEPGKKVFFASMYLFVSKKYGTVLDFNLLTPIDGVNAMHARFPDLLIKSILKMNIQPAAIEIRHPVFYQMAKQVLHTTKLQIHQKPVLSQLEDALQSFEASFR